MHYCQGGFLMKEMTMRPYQQECLDVINHLDPGSYLVVMATGLGKTAIFTHMERKGRVLILSHRDELVRQPLQYYDCSCGVEEAEEHSNGEEVVSASVQSLWRRLDRFKPDDFDTIITDEAHHAAAPSYRKIYDFFKPRLHIGFTATPNRGDKVRLDDVYDSIIFQRDLKWGIEQEYLTNINCLRVDIGYDLSKIKVRRGDLEPDKLSEELNQECLNKGIALAYEKYAKGQTIIFATSVAHAMGIAREIEGAVVISAETKERDKILDRFREKEIRCIVNCMVLTEGTDLPMTETVIVARPTLNASLYQQMVGRGLRKYPGKEYLTLIDCVGITGRLDICTAPSLFGLDYKIVPQKQREKIQGMLTDMPELLVKLSDTPDAWILNATNVDVFAKNNNLDLANVNWKMQCDDSLVCSTGKKGHQIIITPIDSLGKCELYWKVNGHTKSHFINMKPKNAIRQARNILTLNYPREEKIWNMDYVKNWGSNPASDAQKNLIKKILNQKVNIKKYDSQDFDVESLDKYQASVVLDHLLNKK